MSLNAVVTPSTAGGLMAPKPKLNGINVPQVLFDEVQAILSVEKEAFVATGGETKKTSMSDIVTAALRDYVRTWRKRHGLKELEEIPEEKDERREFVKRVGLTNLERTRRFLLRADAEDQDDDDESTRRRRHQ